MEYPDSKQGQNSSVAEVQSSFNAMSVHERYDSEPDIDEESDSDVGKIDKISEEVVGIHFRNKFT